MPSMTKRKSLPSSLRPQNEKTARKKWTELDLRTALAAVTSTGPERLSKRAAERIFGVSAKAIGRCMAGQKIGVKPGRTSALRAVKEDALIEGLLDRARRGFPATRLHLKAIVLDAISDGRAHQFGPYGPSTKWIPSFLSRHSSRLTVRKARILDSARVNRAEMSEIEYFFAEYADFLKKHPLTPAQIYNCDETGVDPQGGTPKKVITLKGAKSVEVQIGQDRENTTVLSAISASGALIPPLFIFKGVGFPSDFLDGAPPGSKGTSTPSAFIDSVIFEEWIDHFIEHIPASRPVLLILDNHASHVGLPVRRKCVSNGIHLLSFPPHTTHVHQPLDAGCFRSFKSKWRDVILEWPRSTGGASLPRHCRSEIIGKAILEAFTPLNIIGSWRSTGMWPVNKQRVLESLLKEDLRTRWSSSSEPRDFLRTQTV